MKIGVPKEIKQGERRVGLVPDIAAELVKRGHTVLVEQSAGEGSGFLDEEFAVAGATILSTAREVWDGADLIVKVKEPLVSEFGFFRPNLGIFCFLHPAIAPDMVEALISSKSVAMSYDLVMLTDGRLPVLEPMSLIAGKLSVQCGAYALESGNGGRGLLLCGTVGVEPAKVVIIGAGSAGSSAAKLAIDTGASVTVLDIASGRLQPFVEGHYRTRTLFSSPQVIRREVADADLVIGAVLVPGARAPKLVTREMVAGMKKGAVIVDISIDQGGCFETSRPTTIAEPIFRDEGVLHYCVTNMPALVPRTSTQALTASTRPWILSLADSGIKRSLESFTPLARSLVTACGNLCGETVAQALGRASVSAEEAIKSLADGL